MRAFLQGTVRKAFIRNGYYIIRPRVSNDPIVCSVQSVLRRLERDPPFFRLPQAGSPEA
jgi:hypothetical protein